MCDINEMRLLARMTQDEALEYRRISLDHIKRIGSSPIARSDRAIRCIEEALLNIDEYRLTMNENNINIHNASLQSDIDDLFDVIDYLKFNELKQQT